ncbi:N-6 DNA methylase [Flammeovirga sp. SJP92]|uniref:N-6 DNA methylase n=1 Tax=Flammeovirga sp. SJP92 TaxID=1775430 RepID=UPI0007899794|nr:N-6 DNA methylase [Flammeovirga sp. SJP92]KXX72772.1 hypothetical protein AVL50_32240 [Flammeovirga sp. SJP92]
MKAEAKYNSLVDDLIKAENYQLTETEIEFLKNYNPPREKDTGEYNLYEYFTPFFISEIMYKLAVKHGYQGGSVLDPSSGTGRLLEYFPSENHSQLYFVERDEKNHAVGKALYPDSHHFQGYFEETFLEKHKRSRLKSGTSNLKGYPFDLIMTNPPYGPEHKNKYSIYFRNELKKLGIKKITLDGFFILKSLDLLKKDGLMVILTASAFLSNNNNLNGLKSILDSKCTLEDAYRLPSIFDTTKVPTDIIILRKK